MSATDEPIADLYRRWRSLTAEEQAIVRRREEVLKLRARLGLRTYHRLEPAQFWIRLRKGGRAVLAEIRRIETTSEPGEPGNDMAGTRSAFMAAFINGSPATLEEVLNARPVPDVSANLQYRLALAEYESEHGTDDDNPRKPVDWSRVPLRKRRETR